MFLDTEKEELCKRRLKYNEIEIKFLKLYNELVFRSKLCKTYFLSVKEMIVKDIIIKYKAEIGREERRNVALMTNSGI